MVLIAVSWLLRGPGVWLALVYWLWLVVCVVGMALLGGWRPLKTHAAVLLLLRAVLLYAWGRGWGEQARPAPLVR